jgi:hypothetical protein
MPCQDYGRNNDLGDRISDLKERLDKATRAACEMVKFVSADSFQNLSKETQSWVYNHKLEDVHRLKDEEVRRRVLGF